MKTKELILALLILVLLFALVVSFDANADGCGYIEIHGIGRYDLTYGQSANSHQHIAQLSKQSGCQCVGNHYGSQSENGGQWKLENLRLGDKAHLEYDTADGLEVIHHSGDYVCYAVMIVDVVDGRLFCQGKEVLPFSETDLILRTCVGHDSTRNYVAFFEMNKGE